LFLTF
jgi:hypothetical protein